MPDLPAAIHLRHPQWAGWTRCSRRVVTQRQIAPGMAGVWFEQVTDTHELATCPACRKARP